MKESKKMKKLVSVVAITILSLVAQPAEATQSWNIYEVKVERGKQAEFAEAFNKFWQSEDAKGLNMTARLHQYLFNGSNPATHSIITIHPSRAAMSKAFETLAQSKAFQSMLESNAEISSSTSDSSMSTLKGWGTISPEHVVWVGFRINASDPLAVAGALEELMTSPAMKGFPGEVWLSAVAFGNAGSGGTATHIISAGYKTVAEMEEWSQKLQGSPTMLKFGASMQGAANMLNTELSTIAAVHNSGFGAADFKQ